MFTLKNIIEDGISAYILADENSKTNIKVLPSCGAILQSFNIVQHDTLINIIDNDINVGVFEASVASAGFKSCKLSPFACRVNKAKYKFADKIYTIKKFVLNENALHGLLYDAPFSIKNCQADEDKAIITLYHKYRGEDDGYPFCYDCTITYKLEKGNTLTLITEINNKTNGMIPMQDGWHPYFTFGGVIDDLQLEFQSKELLECNDALIPTGKLLLYTEFIALKKIGNTIFDNCFTINFAECQPLCVVRDSNKKMQLEIYPGKNYPYLQIYTPPHRKSIAIENLSAAPDAFNNGMGLITLQAGEKAIFETTYKISLLE